MEIHIKPCWIVETFAHQTTSGVPQDERYKYAELTNNSQKIVHTEKCDRIFTIMKEPSFTSYQ
jgi:hypothetical protein